MIAGLRRWRVVVLCALTLLIATTAALAQNSAEGQAKPPEKAARSKPETAATTKPDDEAAQTADEAEAEGEEGATASAPGDPDVVEEQEASKDAAAGTGERSPNPKSAPAASPAANAAEGAGPPVPGRAPELRLPPAANSAEARASGASSTNFAEGWDTTAVPPDPDYKLPEPAEIAGESRGYSAPEIKLVVPGLDPLPDLTADDAFQRPGREYLEQRPLPSLDETETDEERIAKNIEDSLSRIDLSNEARPTEDVKLDTASGSVIFRAADAFQFDRQRRVMTFTGNAEVFFSGMLVAADFIEVNDGAATAYARDYVMIAQNDEIIYADEAYINYDTLQLELFWIEGSTGGTRLSNGVVYFEADRAHGTFDNLIMEHVKVTTCDPYCGDVDEVHLSAKKAVYRRDRSIVLHDVHPHMRSHKIGWIPVLAFPLVKSKPRFEQEESDIQQNYGWKDSEGWFAKFAYTYYTKYVEKAQIELRGRAKLEIVQNLGVGVGLRHDFYIPALGVTTAEVFYQRDWPEAIATGPLGRKRTNGNENFDFKLDQELNLSRALRGTLLIDRVNRFIPAATVGSTGQRVDTWANSFNLSYAKGDTQASLAASQNIDTSGGQTSGTTTNPRITRTTSQANFNLTQQVNEELKLNVQQNYSSTKSGGSTASVPADQEGTFATSLDYTGKTGTPMEGYRAQLSYREQGIDYDQNDNRLDNNVQINKELPKLRIDFPRDLINDGAYFNSFDMSFANLVSGRRRTPQSSFAVNLHAGGSDNWRFSRASRLNTTTNLNQYFYDDGNAQYTIDQTSNYTYNADNEWSFNLGHNLRYRQGVKEPPVPADRRAYSQSASMGFTVSNRRSWRWQMQSNYNFAGKPRWNAITSTFSWDPNRSLRLLYNTSYNPKTHDWGLSTVQSSWLSPYIDERGIYNWVLNTSLDIETNYWEDWRLAQIRASYFRRYERGWSTEIVGGYRRGQSANYPPDFNDWGATEDFLRNVIKTVTVRKVNCCTTIEGSWSAARHEYQLKFYLNALPQYTGSTNINRFEKSTDSGAVQDRYLYEPQFLFPTDALRNDILYDLFGIQASF